LRAPADLFPLFTCLDSLVSSICKIYSIPAAELFYKYEAHLLSLPTSHPSHPSSTSKQKTPPGSVDIEIARELRKVVMREQQLGKTGMHGVAVGSGGVGASAGGVGVNGTLGNKAGVKRSGAGDIGGL